MKLVALGVALVLAGGLAALLFRRHARLADRAFGTAVVAGCLVLAGAAVYVLRTGAFDPAAIDSTLPGGPWVFGLDRLSAWFLLAIALAAPAATVFGIGYLDRERDHLAVAPLHAALALLLAAMVGVLVARSGLLFLLVWELMAVSAYLMVVADHRRKEARQAGLVYLVLTHAGSLALLIMFLVWGRVAPDLRFTSLAAAAPGLGSVSGAVLLLGLFGFGIKAGIVPLHVWLPAAHAAAPSHVSAVLSGLMIKTGVYGILRMLILLGGAPAWWAWLVFLLGLGSAIAGVLWTFAQHDLKRVLAYSSVEHVGLVMLGVGLGLLGLTYQRPAVAVLGYTAALFHVLGHALFKGLLFCGAGAVQVGTGTREIDRLGGLARSMPRTARLMLVGSIAIAGLPPLTGFVSEWLLMRGLLDAGVSRGPIRFAGLGVAGIAVVAALALACFARLVGTAFLGQARDPSHVPAGDSPNVMLVPLALLALAGAALAAWPALAIDALAGVVALLPGGANPGVRPLSGTAPVALTWLVLGVVAAIVLVRVTRGRAPARTSHREAATWGCAYGRPTARMQYTGSSFGAPILTAFARVAAPGGLRTVPDDRFLLRVVVPAWRRVGAVAAAIRPLQRGRVTTYLQYIVWTVLLLLGFLFVSVRWWTP